MPRLFLPGMSLLEQRLKPCSRTFSCITAFRQNYIATKVQTLNPKLLRRYVRFPEYRSRTTPYHPMGNGMVERFNHTLLNMLGTMSEKQMSDWKSHVPTLTHAYNAAVHESTGFSPFYLMFGRHPRLAIDSFLGIRSSEERKSHQDYVDKLKNRLADAYQNANEEARHKGKKYKHYYDEGVRHSVLEPGDRVLVKKVGFQGKHKIANIWDSTP